ncbi:MAG: DUF1214 domain-containing protein [Hyphomicrobiaceae bacterium]|nr:DUF1214 domain-containing protein [Hyphomicrobiaceae bacterium]
MNRWRHIGLITWATLLALGVGLGSAYLLVGQTEPLGSVRVGAWRAWPDAAAADANPYSRAMVARTGTLPLAQGEGFEFFAVDDSGGRALSGTCLYRIAGPISTTRIWTLVAYDAAGRLMANAAGRSFITSRLVTRGHDGEAEIVVSAAPMPGNWLPLATEGRFMLALRLYDTSLSMGDAIRDMKLPTITAEACP